MSIRSSTQADQSFQADRVRRGSPVFVGLTKRIVSEDRVLLGAILLATAAVITALFHPFVAPDNDYASFEHVAKAFSNLELPSIFKRGPVLPALMTAIAPISGGMTPYLSAVLLINASASLFNVVLVYAIARRLCGPRTLAGGLSAALFVGSVQFMPMALQPLVEPTLGTSVLLAALAILHSSRLAYAAAAFAALGRVETVLLVPLIAVARLMPTLVEVRRGRKAQSSNSETRRAGLAELLSQASEAGIWREAVLSIAALIPLGVWMLLTWRFDSGEDTYAALLQGTDYATAPSFLLRSIREPFMGWYKSGDPVRALIIAVPVLVGIRVSIGRMGWRATVLFALWILSAIAVVRFGADKARYVYATSWIPTIAFAIGLERIAAWVSVRLRDRPFQFAILLSAILAVGWIDRVRTGLDRVLATRMPPLGELAWTGAETVISAGVSAGAGVETGSGVGTSLLGANSMDSLILAGYGLWLIAVTVVLAWSHPTASPDPANHAVDGSTVGRPLLKKRAVRASGWLIVQFFATPLVLGGLHGVQRTLDDVYYDNYELALAARWLADNMAESERAVMLVPSHGEHVAGIDPARLIAFAQLGVETRDPEASPTAIASAMDELSATYAVYTWRAPVGTPSSGFYYDFFRTDLSEVFADGDPIPGFEHVATLELPEGVERLEDRRPVQVYRRIRSSP